MAQSHWKVGELAGRTGLTVRMLHHYDKIGLVRPSERTESGHRLYTEADIARLQQVVSLKELGFALEEIKGIVGKPELNPAEIVAMHLERVNRRIELEQKLRKRLEQLHLLLSSRQSVSTEQFILTIEVIQMNANQYFTPEQLEAMKKRVEGIDPAQQAQAEQEWNTLMTGLRRHMESGTPPRDPEAAELAKRWKSLIELFSGGDPAIIRASERFHADNPGNPLQYGMDGRLYQYIGSALSQ